MSFPVGFLAVSVAVGDSFAGTAEPEWVAVGACGVAVGA